MPANQPYDIAALERHLENVEENDAEAQKLYNNLGLAHAANGQYRLSLTNHREEKRACKRLVSLHPHDDTLRLDLAIAYRRCGDVMLRVDRVVDTNHTVHSRRADVLRLAHAQHAKGLATAREVCMSAPRAAVEQQAACAALAQSALALALETRQRSWYEAVVSYCMQSARLADGLSEGAAAVTELTKQRMLLGLSVNMAIAISGLSERTKAVTLLQAVVLRAREVGDDMNLVRAVANLAEEAGEDGDWELCERYVREWVRLARKNKDEADECDALRKLAQALNETKKFEEALEVVERALLLAKTPPAREEARHFLNVVEGQLEDIRVAEKELAELEKVVAAREREGNFVEEAKAAVKAGDVAFKLAKYEDTVRLLGRYFTLADDFGCNTAATDIPVMMHNTSVANMGEAMWSLKRYAEAVHWASREVSEYGSDIGGQAQAWCNLGVYLDDYKKKEQAIDALRTSIRLAEEAGEEQIRKKAQVNLELVIAADVDEANDAEMQDSPALSSPDVRVVSARVEEASEVQISRCTKTTGNIDIEEIADVATERLNENHCPSAGERSIMVISSQPMNKAKNRGMSRFGGSSQDVSGRRNTTPHSELRSSIPRKRNIPSMQTREDNSKSNPSRGGTTADCSSVGVKKFVDLATQYQLVCRKRQHPPVLERAMIVSALRSLSSTLLAREACEDEDKGPAKLDVSKLFLNNYDVSVLCETLSRLNADQEIYLDMGLNPMITPQAYDCLNPRSFASVSNLHAIRRLNLSCAGVSGNSLRVLADALSEAGALRQVSYLNISKNGLGRQSRATAEAVAMLMFRAARIEVLDLSLNILPNTFMSDLMNAVDRIAQSSENLQISDSSLRSMDLHLNNRRYPTALLETEQPDAVVKHFRTLFTAMPGLESVDVRACGGSGETRKALRDLARGFESFSQNIVVVSPEVYEEEL